MSLHLGLLYRSRLAQQDHEPVDTRFAGLPRSWTRGS